MDWLIQKTFRAQYCTCSSTSILGDCKSAEIHKLLKSQVQLSESTGKTPKTNQELAANCLMHAIAVIHENKLP